MSTSEHEIYNPPGALPLVALTEIIMRQERQGWSKAMLTAMERREAAHQRREQERERERRRRRAQAMKLSKQTGVCGEGTA